MAGAYPRASDEYWISGKENAASMMVTNPAVSPHRKFMAPMAAAAAEPLTIDSRR